MTSSTSGIKHIPSLLARQTLLDKELTAPVANRPQIRLLPWLQVIKVGGRAIMDRGAAAILPLVEELRRAMPEHRMLILTGAGIRARHLYGVGLGLGLPFGSLAPLAASEAGQNGHMLAALLANRASPTWSTPPSRTSWPSTWPPCGPWSGAPLRRTTTTSSRRPSAASRCTGRTPVPSSWLTPSARRSSPSSRTWTGSTPATRTTPAPSRPSSSGRPPSPNRPSAAAPPFDATLLEVMATAKHLEHVQVVNGLVPGRLIAALRGEHVGTIVRRDHR
jgi:molybdenum storage protein